MVYRPKRAYVARLSALAVQQLELADLPAAADWDVGGFGPSRCLGTGVYVDEVITVGECAKES